MQIRPSSLYYLRFGNTDNDEQGHDQEAQETAAHLGDIKGWLESNLTPQELIIAQQIADAARAEGADKIVMSKLKASGQGTGGCPRQRPDHIGTAIALAQTMPGIAKLNALIQSKIAAWRAGGKSPKHLFAQLSVVLRELTSSSTVGEGQEEVGTRRRKKPYVDDRRAARAQKRWA